MISLKFTFKALVSSWVMLSCLTVGYGMDEKQNSLPAPTRGLFQPHQVYTGSAQPLCWPLPDSVNLNPQHINSDKLLEDFKKELYQKISLPIIEITLFHAINLTSLPLTIVNQGKSFVLDPNTINIFATYSDCDKRALVTWERESTVFMNTNFMVNPCTEKEGNEVSFTHHNSHSLSSGISAHEVLVFGENDAQSERAKEQVIEKFKCFVGLPENHIWEAKKSYPELNQYLDNPQTYYTENLEGKKVIYTHVGRF